MRMSHALLKPGCLLLAVLLCAASLLPAADDAYVAVAWYANRPEVVSTDGIRVGKLLREHGIKSIAAGSASMTISVSRKDAAEAVKILGEAIRKEKLQIHLVAEDA